MQWCPARPQRFGRSRAAQLRTLGGRGVPPHEGWKRRSDRLPNGRRDVAENRSEKTVQRMERPRGSYWKACGNGPGSKTEIYIPDDGNRYPTLKVSWDQQAWGFTITDCVQQLRAGDPVIEVLGADNPSLVPAVREGIQKPNTKELKEVDHIELVSMTIQPGEEMIIGQRLRAILGAARKGKSA